MVLILFRKVHVGYALCTHFTPGSMYRFVLPITSDSSRNFYFFYSQTNLRKKNIFCPQLNWDRCLKD